MPCHSTVQLECNCQNYRALPFSSNELTSVDIFWASHVGIRAITHDKKFKMNR
jgi:hypothetical protein